VLAAAAAAVHPSGHQGHPFFLLLLVLPALLLPPARVHRCCHQHGCGQHGPEGKHAPCVHHPAALLIQLLWMGAVRSWQRIEVQPRHHHVERQPGTAHKAPAVGGTLWLGSVQRHQLSHAEQRAARSHEVNA